MIQQARKRLLIAALTFVLSGAMAVPAQAGIIPWAWDTLFGPVGSIRARRMCNVGYGIRNRCGYGPMSYGAMSYGSCGGGCSPCSGGACGLGCGCDYGGYGSSLSMGSCATGQCGVNFSPTATPGNLTPIPNGSSTPASSGSRTNPPTFGNDPDSTRTRVNPYPPPAEDRDFDAPPASSPADSVIDPSRRLPAGGRPSIGDDDDLMDSRPLPLNNIGGKITWSSKSKIERLNDRNVGTRSVQVTRQGAFPNSKWEVVGETREVAKK